MAMKIKARTYEFQIRWSGLVLVLMLLAANISLFWLSTRLSRQLQENYSQRLALIAELAFQNWREEPAAGAAWSDFVSRWGLSNAGIVGRGGLWLAHNDRQMIGREAGLLGGMDPGKFRILDEKGGVFSAIYWRDGVPFQSYYLSRERGSLLVMVEHNASFIQGMDRAIALQTVLLILGSLGVLVLLFRYLQLVLSPFHRMVQATRNVLDGDRPDAQGQVEFVIATYQKALEELKRQGRTLQDLYDQSQLRADRIERINRHLLESLDRGVAIMDSSGRLSSANRAALAMFEADDHQQLESRLKEKGVLDGQAPDQTVLELESGRYVQVIKSRLTGEGNSQAELLFLFSDITALRKQEEQLVFGENVRLLKNAAQSLMAKVKPALERLGELLEERGEGDGSGSLREINQAIEDLGRHLQFSTSREEPGEELKLLDQPGMKRVLELVDRVAPTESTVLIIGESGTGKELVAKLIHKKSPRRDGPFVSINCGALPENLIESELFGYVKGAFTGAYRDKAGLLTAADGGTFLLDEVGELSPALQVKLLRVLQEREVVPVGGVKPKPINIRVIAATNRDLEQMVREGRFRQDLYYRLNIFPLVLPPLRKRLADIGLLSEVLISRICARYGQPVKILDPESLTLLRSYQWPGNVRELENVLERALVVSQGLCITPEDIDLPIEPQSMDHTAGELWEISKKAAAEAERQAIKEALEKAGGNKSRAAKMLKISYRVMLKKIKDYELE